MPKEKQSGVCRFIFVSLGKPYFVLICSRISLGKKFEIKGAAEYYTFTQHVSREKHFTCIEKTTY